MHSIGAQLTVQMNTRESFLFKTAYSLVRSNSWFDLVRQIPSLLETSVFTALNYV